MSAVIAAILILTIALSFAGCGGMDLKSASKNLDDYSLTVNYDASAHSLSVLQIVKTTNRHEEPCSALKFHIYAAMYRQEASTSIVPTADRTAAYPKGYSYGSISFDQVSINNSALPFVIEGSDGDILSVPLEKPLEKGQKVTVVMVYQIDLANIWHRTGYGDQTVNLGNWFPILCAKDSAGEYLLTPYYAIGDPFVSDLANYTVKINLPSQTVLASSGSITSQKEEGANREYVLSALAVRDFALVLSNSFNVISENVGGTQINYYYYADAAPQESLKIAKQAVEFFNGLVGQYPYPVLSVAETDFCYGGMEYPCLVYISDALSSSQRKETIVHEIAHQWFYGIIGSDQINSPWQDEGLTEFCTLLFFDAHSEYKLTLKSQIMNLLASYVTYLDILNTYLTNVDTSMNRSLGEYLSQQEYLYIAYAKGCLMFYELYGVMGAPRFEKALKRYFDKCAFTTASPQNLYDAFSYHYGANLTDWFNCYMEGKDLLAVPENSAFNNMNKKESFPTGAPLPHTIM